MPVGSVTKHNAEVLISASCPPLTHPALPFLHALPLYRNNIPERHPVSILSPIIIWLTSCVLLVWRDWPLGFQCFNLARRQAVALPISCSEAGSAGLNNHSGLSLHILSKLMQELQGGRGGSWWWSCVALYWQQQQQHRHTVPQINESGAAECCFELFCVALVSVIAE